MKGMRTALFWIMFLCLTALPSARAEQSSAENEKWKREVAEKRTKDSTAFSQLMDGVDSLEIFFLDPAGGVKHLAQESPDDSRLDGWKIVQRLETTKSQEIRQLVTGLKQSIETSPAEVAPCFEPRHALRFKKDGVEVLVLVCFRCVYLEVKGYPDFRGAAISHAAAKDFYLIFRAHGLTRPNRLAGQGDDKIARQLAGSWRHRGRQPAGRMEGTELAYDKIDTFATDGTYQSKETISLVKDGQAELFRETSDRGRWRVQDGMLIMSSLDSNDLASSAPVESWDPLVEITPARFVTASLAPNSDKEYSHERVP